MCFNKKLVSRRCTGRAIKRRAFFSEDNVLYLAIMPLCFAFTIGVLLPLIIPIICALIRWTMKRKDVRITKWFYITSSAFEIISAVVAILIITKDAYVP